jgi:hypothetical protein
VAAIDVNPSRAKARRLCLDDASAERSCEITCQQLKHCNQRVHADETFGAGAFTPPGLHLDRHSAMGLMAE